ncbi:MAG: tannase/feruloyl esterase family alpha/beta hydrolase [Deltaproteobacteria bacterium]|nr:tannase/feruloyl esterase family alpha/beta hydrolase [Deltaproteobacteria bacterium]
MKKITSIIVCIFLVAFAVDDVGAKNRHHRHKHPTEAVPGVPVIDYMDLLDFDYPGTVITEVILDEGGDMPAHCIVKGFMNERTGIGFPPITPAATTYAIGFEMRLPTAWNGRYFYQANGGIDGAVVPAYGNISGGGSALEMGFTVISSDTGHGGGPFFGMDHQARIDYGYNAVAELTPMAKSLIKNYYGKFPDKSYFAGCSNGGRHTMVAASRYADEYDGFFAGSPGFNLPQAAIAQVWGAQQYATISEYVDGRPDISSSFSPEDTALVSDAVLAVCDGIDGVVDGMVSDPLTCQALFNINRDVPTCEDPDEEECLTYAQKSVLARIHAGAMTGSGDPVYTHFLWDPGIRSNNWRFWEFTASRSLDPGAVGLIFSVPPDPNCIFGGLDWVLNWNGTGFDVDRDAPKIYATDDTYTEASMSFMTPPDLLMKQLYARGGKLIVFHGTSDAVFSVADTINWYEALSARYRRRTKDFARLFIIPGMAHCSGGPACDRFDLFHALVDWVEKGIEPDTVTAWPNPDNPEVPSDWSPSRTRPLCSYPAVPVYQGGDLEDDSSFRCE